MNTTGNLEASGREECHVLFAACCPLYLLVPASACQDGTVICYRDLWGRFNGTGQGCAVEALPLALKQSVLATGRVTTH